MRSKTVRSTLAASAALCATAVAGAGIADGHRFKEPTTAAIESGGPSGAQGNIESDRARCEKNRLVTLYRVSEEGPPRSFGTDTTDENGNWAVTADLFAGDYYVTVARKPPPASAAGRKRAHKHVCKGTRSPTTRL